MQMLMNWINPYDSDLNLTAYEEALGTGEETGTPPENIIGYFEENEISITAKEKRTINNLTAALDKGHPVLMCIQAWAASDDGYNTENPDDEDTYLPKVTGLYAWDIRSWTVDIHSTLTIRRVSAIAL